jgi:protein phosphatase
MRLKVGAATSVGRVRPTNEDAYLVLADHGLFVVCDGMGGAAAGEVASQLAVDTIATQVANGALIGAEHRGFQPRTAGLGKAIEAANGAIIAHARDDQAHAGMGTTVVGMWFGDGLASIAHVGDSRAYLRSESGFEALTSDHSLVEAQVRAGLIGREQSLQSEHQNILLRALGRDSEVDVELSETTVAIGDRVLLCTDGLTRTVSDEGLAAALDKFRGDPQGACDHLIEMANNNGGPDNVTAVVVEFQGSRLSSVFQKVLGS